MRGRDRVELHTLRVNAPASKLAFRRALRRGSPDAERVLWEILRGRRLAGVKFRRQHSVGPYVLDFYCSAASLGIEADGGQHFTEEGQARDGARSAYLEAQGIAVLRFTDREILVDPGTVVETIWSEVTRRVPHRSPLTPTLSPLRGARGEGDA